MLVTLLSFIVVLGIIVFVHELGHFLAAKSVGIRVEQFSLGYPPKMVGRKVGDTEYRLSWIPLGGYVKMSGMIDESLNGESSLTGAPWEFASKGTWAKLWVILAGVMMNFVLAILLFSTIAATKGVPEPGPYVGAVTEGGPAEQAGLLEGDRIAVIDGRVIETWDDLISQIQPRPGHTFLIQYEREGKLHQVPVQAEEVETEEGKIGRIGIMAGQQVIYREARKSEALLWGARATAAMIAQVGNTVKRLITREASIKQLGGPVLIAKLSGDSARQGLLEFLFFIAFISINIGCLNLLPVPALDGGHALIILTEGAIRRELPTKVKLALQQTGMVLLLALVLFIVWNDIQRVFDLSWVSRIF